MPLTDIESTSLSFEEIQTIERELADPVRIGWHELRLYSRIHKKMQSHNVEFTHV